MQGRVTAYFLISLSLASLFSTFSTSAYAADAGSDDDLRAQFNDNPAIPSGDQQDDGVNADPGTHLYMDLIADTRRWRVGPHAYDSCRQKVKAYQCENSPWRRMTLRERYEELTALLQRKLPNYKFNGMKNAIPCFMTRESINLEPLQIDNRNCDPGAAWSSSQGLGQVTFATFCYTLGLTPQEITAVAHGGKISPKRAAELRVITDVAPFNSIEYREDPMRMFQEFSDNVSFEIDVILHVLQEKQNASDQVYHRVGNAPISRASQFLTLENYNGSDAKREYAEAVTACESCLNTNPSDPVHCLGLSMNTRNLNDYSPCSDEGN